MLRITLNMFIQSSIPERKLVDILSKSFRFQEGSEEMLYLSRIFFRETLTSNYSSCVS